MYQGRRALTFALARLFVMLDDANAF